MAVLVLLTLDGGAPIDLPRLAAVLGSADMDTLLIVLP